MSYAVKKNNDEYTIYEKNSDSVIEIGTDEKEARDFCRKLNLGAGFEGWTPGFFTKRSRKVKYT